MSVDLILETAIEAAVSAGNILLSHYNDVFGVSQKESLRDVVTEVDKIAEQRIINILQDYDSDIGISTEEHGQVLKGRRGRCWVIDALDGTVNYVNRIPFFGVSIGFIDKGRPFAGVVYNPMSEELYYGALGIGVFKNQKKLKLKDRLPQECLFSAAFSGKNYYNDVERKEEFLVFRKINDNSRGCLRTGSAAINLAYLAEGRFGGCWGRANKFWDVAAGLVLAELAGAKVRFSEVAKGRHLVNYLAALPSSWDFINEKAKLF